MIKPNDSGSFFSTRCVLGTAGLGGVWGPVNVKESVKAIIDALESGCGAIDTAPAYGDAEVIVGEALKDWRGLSPSISTKTGRLKTFSSDAGGYDYSNEGLESSVVNSLQTLGVDAIDVLFLHEPEKVPVEETERVTEKMLSFKERGMAKQIGLGGNYPDRWYPYISEELFEVVMKFNKLNVCCMEDASTVLPFCMEHNVRYFNASPLYMGLLGSRFDEFTNCRPEWIPASIIDRARVVKAIADEYEMSLPETAHRFLLGLSSEFNIVVGASNPQELIATVTHINRGPLPHEMHLKILNSL